MTHALGSPPGVGVSPPGAQGPALRDQQWVLEIAASYSALNPELPYVGAPVLPDLVDVLAQGPATIWADSERVGPLTETVLSFGQELLVRSMDQGPGEFRSVLFISAAGSPP